MRTRVKRIAFERFKKSEIRHHRLSYLFWECTTRCNLNCLHCGSDCKKDSQHKDMPLEDFLQALDTIPSPSKNMIIVLSGGEPLLREDIELCGMEIRKRGWKWGMVSNGYRYDEQKHISLLNAGMGALTFSLDGLPESHNWLRNNDQSFIKVDRAIGLAVSSNRLTFDVVTCVNRRNIQELESIYQYLMGKGVKAWRLFTIVPIGRAKDHPDLHLSDPEFRELLDFITEKRQENRMDVKFSCEGYVGPYESKVRDTPFFCRAGINVGSILIDGSISACPYIDHAFVQGNIYRDNFFGIWQTKFEPFRDRSWTR